MTGASNEDTATRAQIAIVAVPYEGHRVLLENVAHALAGKVGVDCVNPLAFDKSGAFGITPPAGSAAEEAASALPGSAVVGAFHHVSAKTLLAEGDLEPSDVLVLGDDAAVVDTVVALASDIAGLRGVAAGKLRNCRQVEHLTAVLISINRRYKSHSSLRVTDLPSWAE